MKSLEEQYDDVHGMAVDKDWEGKQLQKKVLEWDHFESLVAVADYDQMEMKLHN